VRLCLEQLARTHTHTHRHTDTDTHTQTHTQTDRHTQTQTQTQTHTQTDTHTHTHTPSIHCSVNQHRVAEASQGGTSPVAFETLEHLFQDKVTQIGTVLALMFPWANPIYLTRAWCVFEMHVATCNEAPPVEGRKPAKKSMRIETIMVGVCVRTCTVPFTLCSSLYCAYLMHRHRHRHRHRHLQPTFRACVRARTHTRTHTHTPTHTHTHTHTPTHPHPHPCAWQHRRALFATASLQTRWRSLQTNLTSCGKLHKRSTRAYDAPFVLCCQTNVLT
jgi:hypothetical protein